MRALLAAALIGCSLVSFAQQDVEDARRTIASIEGLLQQRPTDATLWFFMSRFQAAAGDRAASVKALERVEEFGEGFLPQRHDFTKVWGDTAFQEVRSRLEAKLPRLDYAPTAFTLEDRGLVPEGIAYDRPSRSFFVGSIAERKVVRVGEDGGVADFVAGPGLDAVLGLAVDAPRRLLYVVSTNALTTEGRKQPRNAVFAYDIDSRRRVERYEIAGAQQLNDVAVAAGGRVFASDSASGAVYEIAVKGPGPSRELLKAGQVRGSNGLAASPDGRRLYIAHSTGLAVMDIASGAVKRLENRTRESIAAIDGLYAWQGELIGVQNVTNPGRVIRIQLAADGDSITGVRTLLSHHHNALDQPTTLAITDHGFFLLAATGVESFGADGVIANPDTVPKPTVLRIPLPR
ncbi:MAG TPA: SMP-30/gluconolactonase/LRE family protein [Usitatibacter sp.]|nr:SMP-30/gluconolactonase/LRE family protein [Usitatibacter sp.]